MNIENLKIGQAGWSVSTASQVSFPLTGSHLQRYAQQFNAVEINSSFYKPHKPSTYERWAATVPANFKFSLKVPKTVTHVSRLMDASLLNNFLDQIAPLREKLGPLVVQLPPSLRFDLNHARNFFETFRNQHMGEIACEPRHASWFEPGADRVLADARVARVVADPDRGFLNATDPGGWTGLVYLRLHGSPRMYYSAYSDEYLGDLAKRLIGYSEQSTVWCIFDNTAAGAALENAFQLKQHHLRR